MSSLARVTKAHLRPAFGVVFSAVLLASGCGSGDGTGGGRTGAGTVTPAPGQQGNGMSPGAGSGAAMAGGGGSDGFGNSMTMGMKPRELPPMAVDPNACQSTSMKAETGLAAVDIVWIID